MSIINLDGIDIVYKIKRVFYSKYEMIIRDRTLIVKVPFWKSRNEIIERIKREQSWLIKRVAVDGMYVLEGKIVYLGNIYKRELAVSDDNLQCVSINDDIATIYTNIIDEKYIKKIVEDWLTKETEKLIKEKIKDYKGFLNVKPNNIYVENLFYRWGSCSNFGNMKFNFKCARLPDYIIDYIVVHELCHLRYLDHSANFWKLVEQVMPDWRRRHDWLNKNGERYIK